MALKRGKGRSRSTRSSSRPSSEESPPDLDDDLEEIEDLGELPEGELTDLVIATFDAVVPKPIRRALATGIGAALFTEEGVRRTVQDLRGDPREVARALADQAERAREGVSSATTKEVLRLLERVESASDLRRLLHGITLELTMQIRFSSDDEQDGTPKRTGFRARILRKPRT